VNPEAGKQGIAYDPRASKPMAAIVRMAVVVVTLALFVSSLFNALLGLRDIAVILALATPLGISAWGFSRAGHNQAAIVLLCTVLAAVVTIILVMNPLGVHDMSITAYGGIVLVSALLLSRPAFAGIVVFTLTGATIAFVADMNGFSRSRIAGIGGWPQYVDFIIITSVFAILGRVASEQLFGSLGDAHDASSEDPVSGLLNRRGFFMTAAMQLKGAHQREENALLVVADLDGFRRVNLVIGQQAADHVLSECGRRLMQVPGLGQPLVGRVGDDEFAVLVTGLPEAEALACARTVHAALTFDFLGVSVRNAAGFARFPRDAHGIEPLMLAAQSGVGHAKAHPDQPLSGPADRI
jgi:diguanylate cyclase (GGDEF)-like protein